MFYFFKTAFLALWVLTIPALAEPPFEVSLYTGIPGVVKLGDSFGQVVKSIQYSYRKIDVAKDHDLQKLRLTEILQYKELGMKIFFHRSGVVLILLQEPFKGTIRSKKIPLFSFSVPPVSDWETLLTRELGPPSLKVSGGRPLPSQALFYSWGDISFNRMGPNELGLYRDAEVGKYRQNNFGRVIQLFEESD